MWSGPRNISTAMMRAWGNRPDTVVVDEPFYAFFLNETRADHPGADEVIAHGETDWRKIVAQLTGESADGAQIFYQKQMTHHLLPEVDRSWLARVTNCFLIRDPARVIASYTKKNHEPTADELGFRQQAEIYESVVRLTGRQPPVVDAADVLRDPAQTLRLLCDAVGVEFTDAMLSWPPGRRVSDGIWAKYWYDEVERSTGFAYSESALPDVPAHLRGVYESCMSIYEKLHSLRLR